MKNWLLKIWCNGTISLFCMMLCVAWIAVDAVYFNSAKNVADILDYAFSRIEDIVWQYWFLSAFLAGIVLIINRKLIQLIVLIASFLITLTMTRHLAVIFVIIILSILGALGDYSLKLAGSGTEYINMRLFIMGAVIFCSTSIGWFWVFKYAKFSTIGIIYGVMSTLLFVVVGIFFFDEKLGVVEIAGIASGIFSLLLLGKFA